jgi:long-chain fatty acid transport protein
MDYQRINYNGCQVVGNTSELAIHSRVLRGSWCRQCGQVLDGIDMDVWKLGVEYKHSPAMDSACGLQPHRSIPIDRDLGEVMFNILAPAVIEDHVTLGFTYTLASGNELTMAYMHGFSNDVSGADQYFFGGRYNRDVPELAGHPVQLENVILQPVS